jgi:NADPH2:quinone reductase
MSSFNMGECNEGDDIAGFVGKVGSNVTKFHPGDRIAAFHISNTTSFEEPAAIPLAAMTAAVGLYLHLPWSLPQPFTLAKKQLPLVVYGAASAVGAYAMQLAKRSDIHLLSCIADKGIPFVETLVDKSKGDVITDY